MSKKPMTSRARQRADTRERVIEAAAEAFAELGFRAASTRNIAARAGTNQGLITYHFKSKEELWRAAMERIFRLLETKLTHSLLQIASDDPRELAREYIREYVRFTAAHPELFRLLVEEGKRSEDRMKWLVDGHMKPLYQAFTEMAGQSFGAGIDKQLLPHALYTLVGASSLIFAIAPECHRVTGMDPTTPEAIENHANFVAQLLIP